MLSSVPLVDVSVFVPELHCLLLWFYSIFWNSEVVILPAFFFFQYYFGYFGSFVALDKLWDCFSYFCEEYLWHFDVDCFEFVDGFGWHGHFENINSSSPRIEYVFPFVSSSTSWLNLFLFYCFCYYYEWCLM